MRVSQKAEYALRAMLELTLRSDQPQVVRTADIAKAQRIPEKFLEVILVELRRGGLIVSQRGPVGGHRLARRPDEISVGEVWRAIDGTANEGASRKNGNGSDPFRGVWDDVDRAIVGVVDHVSMTEIRKRAETAKGVADFTI
jgi:Rrf2 family protein